MVNRRKGKGARKRGDGPVESGADDHRVHDRVEASSDVNVLQPTAITCLNCDVELAPDQVKKCGACELVTYCGKPCQIAHWKSEHKKGCRALLMAQLTTYVEEDVGDSGAMAEVLVGFLAKPEDREKHRGHPIFQLAHLQQISSLTLRFTAVGSKVYNDPGVFTFFPVCACALFHELRLYAMDADAGAARARIAKDFELTMDALVKQSINCSSAAIPCMLYAHSIITHIVKEVADLYTDAHLSDELVTLVRAWFPKFDLLQGTQTAKGTMAKLMAWINLFNTQFAICKQKSEEEDMTTDEVTKRTLWVTAEDHGRNTLPLLDKMMLFGPEVAGKLKNLLVMLHEKVAICASKGQGSKDAFKIAEEGLRHVPQDNQPLKYLLMGYSFYQHGCLEEAELAISKGLREQEKIRHPNEDVLLLLGCYSILAMCFGTLKKFSKESIRQLEEGVELLKKRKAFNNGMIRNTAAGPYLCFFEPIIAMMDSAKIPDEQKGRMEQLALEVVRKVVTAGDFPQPTTTSSLPMEPDCVNPHCPNGDCLHKTLVRMAKSVPGLRVADVDTVLAATKDFMSKIGEEKIMTLMSTFERDSLTGMEDLEPSEETTYAHLMRFKGQLEGRILIREVLGDCRQEAMEMMGRIFRKPGIKKGKRAGGAKRAAARTVEEGMSHMKMTEERRLSEREEDTEEEDEEEEDENECVICFLDLDEGAETDAEKIVQRACIHRFHSACLGLWMETCRKKALPMTCPTCRAALGDE